jgi:hypothetical protein
MNTKEKLQSVKEDLKTLAEEIKQIKPLVKKYMSRIDKEKKDYWKKEDKEFFEEYWKAGSKLSSMKFQFRHKLIAYSMVKGKSYEEIERNVREDNKPNWSFIRGIQDELTR